MSDIVERLRKEKGWTYDPSHSPDHARKDLQYVDGLAAHLDEGGKTNAGNVRDLISMVQWSACGIMHFADEILTLRARIAQLEAQIADEREDAARAAYERGYRDGYDMPGLHDDTIAEGWAQYQQDTFRSRNP